MSPGADLGAAAVAPGPRATAATMARMPTADHLARLFGGQLEGERGAGQPVTAVLTDSRRAVPGAAFVAVRGAIDDGHRFVGDAGRRGALLAIVDRAWTPPADSAGPPLLIRVDDTAAALRRACAARLEELGCTVVGITGSVGKTTAKEMTAHVIGDRAARTPGNLNTWTGVPCSVLSLDTEPEVYVAELAMTARGEIADLAGFTRPSIGVLLNVGISHIELLGSQAAIADAKAELLDALPADGLAVLNATDPLVAAVAPRSAAPVQWYGVGEVPQPGFSARAVETRGLRGSAFILTTWRGDWTRVSMGAPGAHLVSTACAAAAVATRLGTPLAEVAERLGSWRPPEQRGRILEGIGGATVYDDSYNSAPASLHAALEVLRASGSRRRVAVIGDMLELGELADTAHDNAGREVAVAATDAVLIGDHADRMAAAAAAAGMPVERIHVVASPEDASAVVAPLCAAGTTVLVKASHALGLERLVEQIALPPGVAG